MAADNALKNYFESEQRQGHEHEHITPTEVRALFLAADELDSEYVLEVQKIVFACQVCSVVLAEASPTYAGSAYVAGTRAV